MVIKEINASKKAEPAPPPPGPSNEEKLLMEIRDALKKLPQVKAVSIYLMHELKEQEYELKAIITEGDGRFPEPPHLLNESGNRVVQRPKQLPGLGTRGSWYTFLAASSAGQRIGWLAIASDDELSADSLAHLTELARFIGLAFERGRAGARVKHCLGKLEVLNELNKLVASGTGLDRITKTIAREAAFRFGADISLCLLLDDERAQLEIKGSYGWQSAPVPAINLVYLDSFLALFNIIPRYCASASKVNSVPG